MTGLYQSGAGTGQAKYFLYRYTYSLQCTDSGLSERGYRPMSLMFCVYA